MLDLKLTAIIVLLTILAVWAGPKVGEKVGAAAARWGWDSQQAYSAGKYAEALAMLGCSVVVLIILAVRFR